MDEDIYARRYPKPAVYGGASPAHTSQPRTLGQPQRRLGSTAGKSWDEEEHMQFLKGLQAFGKGQWKQISKYYVPSRTPTQVASHAQKHFLRVTGSTKRKSKFAAVDAAAEVEFGAAVTRDGMPGGVQGGQVDGHSDEVRPKGNVHGATAQVAGGTKPPRPSRQPIQQTTSHQTKRRYTVSEAGEHNGGTSEETGSFSTRQAFANGFSLYHGGIKTVPPVQSNGLAVGIPLQEIPDLKAFGGKNLPMLKVIKGRIKATSNLFRPPSPSPSQKKTMEDEHVEIRVGLSRRKRTRRPVIPGDVGGGDFDGGFDVGGALAALADVAAGLADGRVY